MGLIDRFKVAGEKLSQGFQSAKSRFMSSRFMSAMSMAMSQGENETSERIKEMDNQTGAYAGVNENDSADVSVEQALDGEVHADDVDTTQEIPQVADTPHADMTEAVRRKAGESKRDGRVSQNEFARRVFGSPSRAARVERLGQLEMLRTSVERFNSSDFEIFKNFHKGAKNRSAARDQLRKRKIARRQTFKQLATSFLFQGESWADGLGSAAGLAVGYMLSGGFGWHVDRKTGLTRGQKFVQRLDSWIEKREARLMRNEANIDGRGGRRHDILLDNVLIPLQMGSHWLVGEAIPENVQTLATYKLSIMAHAMEEMAKPDADINAVRKWADESMQDLYMIASGDGIGAADIDRESITIGRSLDNSVNGGARIRIDMGHGSEAVSVVGLNKAYSEFLKGADDAAGLRDLMVDGKAAASDEAEAGKSNDKRPKMHTANRQEVPADKIHRGNVASVTDGPHFDNSVSASENVADIVREIRDRGTFGDAEVYSGGAALAFGFSKSNIPAIVSAYRYGMGMDVDEGQMGSMSGFGETLRRVRENLVSERGVSESSVDAGLQKDLGLMVNDMFEGGFDISDPTAEAGKAVADMVNLMVDVKGKSYEARLKQAREIGAMVASVYESSVEEEEEKALSKSGNKPSRTFGSIGHKRPKDSVLDDCADRLRFAFACDPTLRHVVAEALEMRVFSLDTEVFDSTLRNSFGHHGLDYRSHNPMVDVDIEKLAQGDWSSEYPFVLNRDLAKDFDKERVIADASRRGMTVTQIKEAFEAEENAIKNLIQYDIKESAAFDSLRSECASRTSDDVRVQSRVDEAVDDAAHVGEEVKDETLDRKDGAKVKSNEAESAPLDSPNEASNDEPAPSETEVTESPADAAPDTTDGMSQQNDAGAEDKQSNGEPQGEVEGNSGAPDGYAHQEESKSGPISDPFGSIESDDDQSQDDPSQGGKDEIDF